MPAQRPRHLLAFGLASVALALALWWAWDSVFWRAEDEATGRAGPIPASWLDDPAPRTDDTAPAPDEGPSPAPALKPPPKAPPPPPERVQPETLRAPPEPEPPEEIAPEPEREKPPEAPRDFVADSFRERLLGGVARTSARATPEVEAPGGHAWIGTPLRWLEGLQDQRGGSVYAALLMEAPRHVRELDTFFIDRFEVRNHDYLQYLNATARVVYDTSRHPARTLGEIVAYLMPDFAEQPGVRATAAWQMFQANQSALVAAWKDLVVSEAGGVVDLERTYARVANRGVPRGLKLVFYDRPPPGHWPGAIYEAGHPDHPVRDVSVEEAMLYALYKGRYLPSEIQWEYAARGPKGLDHPWDDRGKDFKFNVNGGVPLPRGETPRTQPVTHFPGGASWIGCLNLLGNVSEWTSSYLDVYPNGRRSAGIVPRTHVVVRGGSTADEDRYAVRPAFRGWRTDDSQGAPLPGRRRAWTGFRTARWATPARSRLPTMHWRARRREAFEPALFLDDVFEGWSGEQTQVHTRVAGRNSRWEQPRAGVKSAVLNPLRIVATRDPLNGDFVRNRDDRLLTADQLTLRSYAAPFYFGLLHTDFHLLDLWVDPFQRETFRPGKASTKLRRAEAPPDTYLVGLFNGLPGLRSTATGRIYHVANRPTPARFFNVIERSYISGAPRMPSLDLAFDRSQRVQFSLVVPLHGEATPGRAVLLRMRLQLPAPHVQLVGAWQHGRGSG